MDLTDEQVMNEVTPDIQAEIDGAMARQTSLSMDELTKLAETLAEVQTYIMALSRRFDNEIMITFCAKTGLVDILIGEGPTPLYGAGKNIFAAINDLKLLEPSDEEVLDSQELHPV